jgi:SNF2 family DNA or RNA helicase
MKVLWPFQAAGVEFLLKHKRAILADQMGIGKTRQVIEVLKGRFAASRSISILVVCAKKNAVRTWNKELPKWAPELAEIFVSTEGKSPTKRVAIWEEMPFVIATHQVIMRDRMVVPLVWDIIIIEEPQSWLRNRKTKTFRYMKTFRSEFLIIMTGTPSSKGAQDLWPMLNLINRKVFSSYWRFVNTFCFVDDGMWGKDVYGTRNKEALKELLDRYMIRRLKAEVFPEMPEKLVDTVPLDMTRQQAKAHDELSDELITSLEGRPVMSQNSMTLALRLRQLLVSPKLLNPEAGYGAGIEYLQEVTSDMDPGDRHFVVFTPFKKALPYIGEVLEQAGAGVVYLSGGMSTKQLDQAIDTYDSTRCVAVCVIKYAESFSLASGTLAFFLGAEWNFTENEQAEDRMHRTETTEAVNIYYLQYTGTYEERVVEVLADDRENVSQYLSDPQALQKLLLGELP